MVGLVGVEVSLRKFSIFPSCFSWLVGLVGLLVFELVVLFQLAVFTVGFLFWVGWLGWLGLKFLFENCQFLRHVFSWFVGLVGLLVFVLVVFSC